MAITKYDDILAGLDSGSVVMEQYRTPGYQTATILPKVMVCDPTMTATNLTGEICNANTLNHAPHFALPGAGDSLILDWAVQSSGDNTESLSSGSKWGGNALVLCDLLWKANYSTTSYANGTTTLTISQPDLTRHTSGDGVYPIIFTNPSRQYLGYTTIALVVTDNLNRTGQWAGSYDGSNAGIKERTTPTGIGATRGNLWGPGPGWIPPPVGSGGVKKIEEVRLISTYGATLTGNIGFEFGLIKPLAFLPGHPCSETRRTFSEACSSILRTGRGSGGDQPCLFVLSLSGGGTTTGNPQKDLLHEFLVTGA